MIEDFDHTDTGLFNPPLIPDKLVIVGHSVAVGQSQEGKRCREHVVPRKVICDQAEKMLREGIETIEVARFIADHLKIVWLTKAECDLLNKKEHFNLRQKMPEDWEHGRDHFSRLHKADIPYTLFSAT